MEKIFERWSEPLAFCKRVPWRMWKPATPKKVIGISIPIFLYYIDSNTSSQV